MPKGVVKAVVCRELGPPERLRLETFASAALKPGEVRVAIHAAGINFPDILMAAGDYQLKPELPFTPGVEAAGEVSEIAGGVEGLKVGVTLETGLKKMFDSMPTAEVSFFGIVMTIQQKSGGNLSEALSNLSGVLRDRKRLEGKIKAMSSEAKASAMIIGSLPPGVMGIVWVTTPAYIALLFTERTGNLILAGCAFWMATGIFVMRKMINFKH